MAEIIEIMRVLRTLPKGELQVESNGNRLISLEGLSKRQRFLFLTAVGELIDFVGGYQVLVDAGVAPMLMTKTERETAVSEPEPVAEAPLTPEQQAFLDKLEQQKNALLEDDSHLKEPSIIRTAIPMRRPSAPPPKLAPREKSIVEQINDHLQARLNQDETLKNETIKLRNGSDGKPEIEVNGRIYPNPKAIENPQIRNAIQLAVRDFEKR